MRLEERVLPLVRCCFRVQTDGRLPADICPVVVEQPVSNGQRGCDRNVELGELRLRADPAPHEDRWGEVRTRGEDHGARIEAAAICCDDARGTPSLDDYSIDERLSLDDEIRSRPGRVEVSERRVPALPPDHVRRIGGDTHRLQRVVRVVEEREPCRHGSLDERAMEGSRLVRVGARGPELGPGEIEEGAESLVPPLFAPLVVVGPRALENRTRVDG